jgi:heme exporter protein B
MSVSLPGEPAALPAPEAQAVRMKIEGGLAAFFAKSWAVAAKDLRTELRSKEILGVMVTFGALAVIIFGMAFDLRVPQSELIAPGVLWVVVLFGGVLGLNRTFNAEVDRGSLAALLLAPMAHNALYLGKVLANLLFTLLTEAIILPVMLVLFDVNLFHPLVLAALLLGTIGYVAVGTLFAALTASTRTRESLLPVLLLPVMAPVFMAGVKLTAMVVDGRGLSDAPRWLGILIAYDLIFVTIAFLVFDLVFEEA